MSIVAWPFSSFSLSLYLLSYQVSYSKYSGGCRSREGLVLELTSESAAGEELCDDVVGRVNAVGMFVG